MIDISNQPENKCEETFNPRNAGNIALYILKKIPDDQINFKKDITKFLENSAFWAPELLTSNIAWIRLQHIISRYVGIKKITELETWEKEIIEKYNNKV
jgi:hypothetical protein